MKKHYPDWQKIRLNGYNGIVVAFALLMALCILSYLLLYNPYRDTHEQIFKTADNIRKYYADRPGYWKLSTQSAIDDRLITDELKQKDFEVKIGEGDEGDMAMPSDADFDIALKNLNKSYCIGLVEFPVNKEQQLGLQKISIINAKGTTDFTWGDEQHPLPVAKYSARKVCEPSGNAVLWTFH